MNIDIMAAFLKANPGFFEQHPEVLLNLSVPHPHGGRTVSIPERQLIAAREKVRILETKLAELIEYGVKNDTVSEKLHLLTLSLIGCVSLDQTIDTLYLDLLDNFQVPHVAVRMWNVVLPNQTKPLPELQPLAPELIQFVEAMHEPYCGHHPVYETHLWFGEHAPHLKSYSLTPLKKGGQTFGLLLMASEQAERFHTDMGTLFLTRIGDVAAHVLARQLTLVAASAGS
ncbi:MAG: DUF484 family protein [Betaproteobacteria bacterium]|nr:DUF484 family protein [Betaproteobacteria bacterium]